MPICFVTVIIYNQIRRACVYAHFNIGLWASFSMGLLLKSTPIHDGAMGEERFGNMLP